MAGEAFVAFAADPADPALADKCEKAELVSLIWTDSYSSLGAPGEVSALTCAPMR